MIQKSIALFVMTAQADLTVGAVAIQTTRMFWRNDINCFLVHSFLVSPQIAFCCRIIAACTLSSFEVTRKTLVFSMCVAHVDCQVIFVSEYLVTDSARRLNCVVDIPVGHSLHFWSRIVCHKCCKHNHHSLLQKYVVFSSFSAA